MFLKGSGADWNNNNWEVVFIFPRQTYNKSQEKIVAKICKFLSAIFVLSNSAIIIINKTMSCTRLDETMPPSVKKLYFLVCHKYKEKKNKEEKNIQKIYTLSKVFYLNIFEKGIFFIEYVIRHCDCLDKEVVLSACETNYLTHFCLKNLQ